MVFGSATRILRIDLETEQETRRGNCQHRSWTEERQRKDPQRSASIYGWTGIGNAGVHSQNDPW